jgi:ribosomal protein S18 acetylase RimI-like enzyme
MITHITPETAAAAAELLYEQGLSVSGIHTRSLAHAICRGALHDNGPVVLSDQGGAVVAIANAPAYWRSFSARHPLFAVRVALKRFGSSRGGRASAADQSREGDDRAFELDWNTSRPDVARIVLIAVTPAFCQQGLGARLYEALFDDLRSRGMRFVLARIAPSNVSSLHLHRKTGWILGRRGEHWQALRRL